MTQTPSTATAALEVFLAPHLDDVALSAGGTAHRLAAAGAAVTVLTVCAGRPPEAALSAYALSLHARWGQPPEQALSAAAGMVALRRAEDRAACRRLGAAWVHLRLPDLIYRRRGDGCWAAESDAALFAGAAGVDEATVDALARRLRRWLGRAKGVGGSDGGGSDGGGSGAVGSDLRDAEAVRSEDGGLEGGGLARLWIPLGIGDHVDHHLCRRAAERLAADPSLGLALRYYEDYPYAGDAAARARALAAPPGSRPWRPAPVAIDHSDLAAKLDAVACFTSQISSFWADEAAMRAAVTAFSGARADEDGRTGDGEVDGGEAAWEERFWEGGERAATTH